jgi:hypothetical protein
LKGDRVGEGGHNVNVYLGSQNLGGVIVFAQRDEEDVTAFTAATASFSGTGAMSWDQYCHDAPLPL